MTPDIPRLTGHNAGAEPDANTPGVTWWALMVPCDPPLAVGRTPTEAEERLQEQILNFYREECDPLPADPEARAAIEIARWKGGALLSGRAADELTAFLAWRVVSSLTVTEALVRWRQAFPAPEGKDPLAGLSEKPM